MTGQRLGNWIVDAERGRDALGVTFNAHAADGPERTASIKLITHANGRSPETARLFLAQVELLRKLEHPAILPVLEGGTHEGQVFVVFEDPHGSDCQTLLRQGEKFGWEETLRIALAIVPAIRHAHRRSVLHRDLRPGTLYRGGDGRYRLAEFGITKFFGDVLSGNADDLLGPAAYLTPEQAAGKPYTKRSDFYALGGLLYTLAVGRPPFAGATLVELSHKQCYVLPERPIHFVHDLPEEFDRLVMRLLAKDPAQRPGSGTLLIQEIEGIWSMLERRGQVGKRPTSETEPASPGEALDDEPRLPPLMPQPLPREAVPWLRRWYVVVPIFGACVMVLMWAFVWRGLSADELMARARPLLASTQPEDWDRAWHDYLEPLSRKHPDRYADEVREARRRIDQQGELRRAFVTANAVRYRSEAERFYHEGLGLLQAGDWSGARRVWANLTVVYGGIDDENRWVALADAGIERINARDKDRPRDANRLRAVLLPIEREIKRLRTAGQSEKADQLVKSLLMLYRDDPDIESLRMLLETYK